MSNHFHSTTLSSTASGTLLVVIIQINSSELLQTAVLATIGAVVSFIVSKTMKYLWEKIKNRKGCN